MNKQAGTDQQSGDNRAILEFLRTLPSTGHPCDGSITPWQNESGRQMHVHPDIIERLRRMAADLAPASRGVFCGRPVLFHPVTGRIVAFGFGMSYVVRLPASVAANFRTSRRMSNGTVIDLQRSLGEGWVFGNWSQSEIDGCREFVVGR